MHNKPQAPISVRYASNYLIPHHRQKGDQNAGLASVSRVAVMPSCSSYQILSSFDISPLKGCQRWRYVKVQRAVLDIFLVKSQHFGWLLDTKFNGGACFVAGQSLVYDKGWYISNSIVQAQNSCSWPKHSVQQSPSSHGGI
jgi:hypothetical protein